MPHKQSQFYILHDTKAIGLLMLKTFMNLTELAIFNQILNIKSRAPIEQKARKCDAQDEYEFEVRSDTVDGKGTGAAGDPGGKDKEKKDGKTPVEAVR